MKIQLENKIVETKEVTINGFTEVWFRIDNSNVWYKSPYSSTYDLMSEISKLDSKGLDSLIQLIVYENKNKR